jgi:signal transduction histidine kinase
MPLPIPHSSQPPAAAASDPWWGVERNALLLLVHHDANVRESVARLLTGLWTVTATADRETALSLARATPPALILTDVTAPGLDSRELLQQLRGDERLRSVPVIVLAARDDVPPPEEPFVSADDYLFQPFTARELLARVATHLELARLRREAEVAKRSREEFLALLGHELRNPLAPIVTALQLMRLRGDQTLEKERTIIERQVDHVVRLVDDLLDVSRITRGKVQLKRQPLELARVVAQGIELASPLIEQRQHRLIVEMPQEGLLLDGDATRLPQVVANLLTNAAKYTEPNGEIVVAGTRLGRPGHEQVELRVRDNGIGLSSTILPRVFDLFIQERQTIERAHGGLGLGLAIVRSLVELHGGTVEARSEGPGRGSEFIVRLPAVPVSAYRLPEPRDLPSPALPADAGRVLIVDDNADAAEMICQSVQLMGYRAEIAYDGPAALRLAEHFCPDVALLDIGLPVMDGYELARQLRKLPGLGGVRLIAITGYGQEADRRNAEAAGFERHLVKPIQLEQLREVLDAAVERRA